jgi:hypothetical protein
MNNHNKISITVAMPLYNMGQIATLALEGLCNQKTKCNWELLVCEEDNDKALGIDKLMSYEEKLKAANCVNIKYIPLSEWVPLGMKWKILAQNASNTLGFLLQAGDCYAHSKRIENSYRAFLQKFSYYDEQKGFFYSFRLDKTILFNPKDLYTKHPCRLNMAWKTQLIKKLPDNDKKINIDGYLYYTLSRLEPLRKYRDTDLHTDGVDVDGYNIISARNSFFTEPNDIFEFTDVNMKEYIPILNEYSNLELTVPFKEIKNNETPTQ